MSKNKETYQITLETAQMDFLRLVKEKYFIADESKVVRIMMDYVVKNHTLQPSIFNEVRCLHCG